MSDTEVLQINYMYLSIGTKQRKGKERADKEIFNNVKPSTNTHTQET